jgi:hypothetical protein
MTRRAINEGAYEVVCGYDELEQRYYGSVEDYTLGGLESRTRIGQVWADDLDELAEKLGAFGDWVDALRDDLEADRAAA